MPKPPYYEILDGHLAAVFHVDSTAERPIRVEVTDTRDGESMAFTLSILGAQRFGMVLSSALSRAINGGR